MSDDPKDVRDGVQLSENEEDAIREMMEMLGPWKGRRLGPWRIKDGPAAVKLWRTGIRSAAAKAIRNIQASLC